MVAASTDEISAAAPARPGGRTVLVVEDDRDLSELIRLHLEQDGFVVRAVADGEHALEVVKQEVPALVLLDLMLPGISGLDVCRRLRGDGGTAQVPIAIISARATEADRIVGLEMGADDYITKPFSPRELVARVRAVLRRTRHTPSARPHETYERGRLRIDFDTYEVFVDDRRVELALREFQLLRFFVRAPNRVFDRAHILEVVWGQSLHVEPRTVDVHIRRLRERIERDETHPELIVTVRGVGYRFDEHALDPSLPSRRRSASSDAV